MMLSIESMQQPTGKGHIGTKKTIAEVGKLFECVPRSAIDRHVALCLVCHMWKLQSARAPLKPIVSSGFMAAGLRHLVWISTCTMPRCFLDPLGHHATTCKTGGGAML